MTALPFQLLEALASRDEQVRYILNATQDEYLIPEEMCNDAYHFCERAKSSDDYGALRAEKIVAIDQLKLALDATDEAVLASPTIIDDPQWVTLRNRAADVLRLFGQSVP